MKRLTPNRIVSKLRQAHVELGKGLTVKEVCRKIEVAPLPCREAKSYDEDPPLARNVSAVVSRRTGY